MDVIRVVLLAVPAWIMAVIGAALSRIMADEMKAWTPWLVDWLIQRAARELPEHARAHYIAEWQACVAEYPGDVSRLIFALDLARGARNMRSDVPESPRNQPILLVAESEGMRAALRAVLSPRGYCVRTAGGVAEAISALRVDDPRLLLVDANFPHAMAIMLRASEQGIHGLVLTDTARPAWWQKDKPFPPAEFSLGSLGLRLPLIGTGSGNRERALSESRSARP